jgi:hypothetical protein
VLYRRDTPVDGCYGFSARRTENTSIPDLLLPDRKVVPHMAHVRRVLSEAAFPAAAFSFRPAEGCCVAQPTFRADRAAPRYKTASINQKNAVITGEANMKSSLVGIQAGSRIELTERRENSRVENNVLPK